jgi:hypothetical protein
VTDTAAGFWADTFDADLLKVMPAAAGVLADLGDTPLWTYGHRSGGRLNHPTVWNSDQGLVAYFGTDGDPRKPPSFWTGDALVQCTFEEAIRDAWVHGYAIILNNRHWVFGPHSEEFQDLLYHLRRWGQPLTVERRWELESRVQNDLEAACDILRGVLDDPGTPHG